MKKQSGFTLIELVIVIVILGILAATALPRFVNLAGDARAAKANAALGAMKSAANIAHATQLARGAAHNASITVEGASVTLIGGYPTANAAGIILAAGLDGATDGYTTNGGGGGLGATIDVRMAGATTPATCQASYTAPTSSANSVPTYAIVTTGC